MSAPLTPAPISTVDRATSPRRRLLLGAVVICLLSLAACETGLKERSEIRSASSVMQYLYPTEASSAAMPPADLATLRVPLSIGVAFVPGGGSARMELSEVQRQQMLTKVVEAFRRYPFVGRIEAVPTSYLSAGGGFADLERVSQVFGLDVMALLSYDQMQFTEKTRSSMWYWTLVGAYVVQGDQYDVHTMIESSIVDVKSRKLLFRAAGTSVQQGGATMSNVAEATRAARAAGFQKAADDLIPKLQASLEAFRAGARSGAGGVQLQLPPGYDPAASAPRRRGTGARIASRKGRCCRQRPLRGEWLHQHL